MIEPLKPGETRTVISALKPRSEMAGDHSLLKVLAFSRPIDLSVLLTPPSLDLRGEANSRGSPEENWLADVLRVGPVGTRGAFDVAQETLRISDALMRVEVRLRQDGR